MRITMSEDFEKRIPQATATWPAKDVGRRLQMMGKRLTNPLDCLRVCDRTRDDSSLSRMVSMAGGLLLLSLEGFLQG